MISLLSSVPRYWLSRRVGWPKVMPVNMTVSITSACNSRCLTCNIWSERTPGDGDDLTLDEFDRTFRSLGRTPYWFTISGGEPFLREDIVDICKSLYDHCRPAQINIPTNSLVWRPIAQRVAAIADYCRRSDVVINLSLDGVGAKHDELRGVKGNFDKVLRVFRQLKELNRPNLTVGVHSVISRFNVDHFPELHDFVTTQMRPDSFVSELAEERVELGTIGKGITPSLEEYARAVDLMAQHSRSEAHRGRSRIIQALRREYYKLAKRYLETGAQAISCYAGWASAQIAPNGDVWSCAVRAESIANLRDHDFDFRRVWFSEAANKMRRSIRNQECACPLANAAFTSMLMNPRTMLDVAANLRQETSKGRIHDSIPEPAAALRRR
ncbi:MAG: radical SAM protein [Dehalococcoidia bacterium]